MAKKAARRSQTAPPKPTQDGMSFSDGSLNFKVEGGPRHGEVISIDLLWLQLVSERLQDEHALKVKNDKFLATPEFLSALSKAIKDECGYCTPSLAFQVWVNGATLFDEIQKKII